jgi:hypothetical protein
MKVYALTIFSTLALAFPSFGTDSASHSERHGVLPSEVQQQAIDDRRFDDNTHERVTANLRSTPHRAFEIPVEESQRNESISSVRIVALISVCFCPKELRTHILLYWQLHTYRRKCRRRHMKRIG